MNHSIMISMRCLESPEYGLPPGTGYVKLSTYDREHGRSADFLLRSDTLGKLNNASKEAYASDAYSFMMMIRAAGWVRFCVTWLTGSEKSVAGHIQRFDIPLDGIQRILKRFASGNVASRPPNMKALPKLRNIVPMPAPRAVPGPRIRDRTRATSFTRGERGGGQVNNMLTKRIKRGQVESFSRGELNEADRHRGIVGGAVRNRGQEATVGESSA